MICIFYVIEKITVDLQIAKLRHPTQIRNMSMQTAVPKTPVRKKCDQPLRCKKQNILNTKNKKSKTHGILEMVNNFSLAHTKMLLSWFLSLNKNGWIIMTQTFTIVRPIWSCIISLSICYVFEMLPKLIPNEDHEPQRLWFKVIANERRVIHFALVSLLMI